MKKVLLAGLLAAGSVFSAPVFTVIPNLGPDFFTTSPTNFDGWAANAIAGLMAGGTQTGTGVTAFNPLANGANLVGNEFIATDSVPFFSWMGQLNPTGTFANEYGTQIYFSLIITDSAGSFKLSDLATTMETYLGNPLGGFDIAGNYRSTLWGVDLSNNVLNSGEADTTDVKALYYVGVGTTTPLLPGATPQDQLNNTLANIQNQPDRTTQVCYALSSGGSGCGSVNVQGAIPEPGTWALMGAGLAGLAFLRRRSA